MGSCLVFLEVFLVSLDFQHIFSRFCTPARWKTNHLESFHTGFCASRSIELMDHSPINQNFELNKSRQKFHNSLKEHHKISNVPKFRCKML